MQVIGRRDDHGIEIFDLEEALNVGDDVRDAEPVGEGARFRPIIVEDRRGFSAARLGKNREVRQLRDRAGSYHPM